MLAKALGFNFFPLQNKNEIFSYYKVKMIGSHVSGPHSLKPV